MRRVFPCEDGKPLSGNFFRAVVYLNDHLGTPQKIISASGRVVWSAVYGAYGKATVGVGSEIENNLRFPGQYEDPETRLHYNFFRYYDTETGRYISVDPAKSGLNLYAYCMANPLRFVDPYGLCPTAKISLMHGHGLRYVHQKIDIDGHAYGFGPIDGNVMLTYFYPFAFPFLWESGEVYEDKNPSTIIESFEVSQAVADALNKAMSSLTDPETEGHYGHYGATNWGEHGSNCRSFAQTFYNTFKECYELKPNKPDKPKPDKPDYYPYNPHKPYDPFNPDELYAPFNPRILY